MIRWQVSESTDGHIQTLHHSPTQGTRRHTATTQVQPDSDSLVGTRVTINSCYEVDSASTSVPGQLQYVPAARTIEQ